MPNIHIAKFLRDQAHELEKIMRACPDKPTVGRLELLQAACMEKATEVETIGGRLDDG